MARLFVTMVRVSHPQPPPPPPRPAPVPPWAARSDRRRAGPPNWFALVVAGLPALLAVLLLLLAPGFMWPLFDERMAWLGIPLGVLLLAAVFALSAAGILVAWVARSWIALLLVVVGLMMPALLLLILAPAVVLIAVNLSV